MVRESYTINDVLSQLRKRRLVARLKRLQYSIIHPSYQRTPLEKNHRLRDVGVGPLSSLHIHFHVLGGTRGETSMDGTHCQFETAQEQLLTRPQAEAAAKVVTPLLRRSTPGADACVNVMYQLRTTLP